MTSELKPGEILGFIRGLRNSRQKEHWNEDVGGRKKQSISEELQEGRVARKLESSGAGRVANSKPEELPHDGGPDVPTRILLFFFNPKSNVKLLK